MNVSSWSIKNPIPAVMLFVFLTFAGLLSFKAMKIQNMPDVEIPVVLVTASLPGATPSQLETDVSRKLENSIANIAGIKHVRSTVEDGLVTIAAEFQLEKPLQEAVDDVRTAVSQVRADLPSDVRDPIVTRVNNSDQPLLGYTIASDTMDTEALSWFVDNTLTRQLLTLPGVSRVHRVGGVTREVHVDLDPIRLQSLGASAAEISRQLVQVQNENAGGRIDLGSGEQPIRTLATVKSAQELGLLDIALSNGQHIRLDQVATIKDTVAEPRSSAFFNGKPVVAFEITRGKGESDVSVGAEVKKAIEALKNKYPAIKIQEAYDNVKYTEDDYKQSMSLLYEGGFLAILVVWLFLRDARATFVSAIALPLSILPTFIGMYFFDFTLNGISLLALSLVIGILVDDAIVEVENIVRHLRMGKTPYQAAMEAANEIGLAVIATTFTLIAVFLPTAFMSGVVGRFFKQFGWTAALAVFASLVVARLLTPMMAAYMLKPTTTVHKDPFWMARYLRLVDWCITHRLRTMIAATIFFFASFALAITPWVPKEFIPANDASETQAKLELPPGSTLAQSQDAATLARSLLIKIPSIKSIYTAIGDEGDPRMVSLSVSLTPRGQRPKLQVVEDQMRKALEQLPGARINVGQGGNGAEYSLVLASDDAEALQATSLALEKGIRTIPGIGNISSTANLNRPEIAVHPDFARAAELGVTSAAIGQTLRVATLGDYDTNLPKLNLAERQIPIVVKLEDHARKDIDLLQRLSVPSTKGQPVMLGQVAKLEMSSGPSLIRRYDRARNVRIDIELSGLPLGDVMDAVKKLPAMQQLPPSVKLIQIGDAEAQGELVVGFVLAMLTGILCIYAVLVLLFKNFLQPITILCALPLAVVGAVLGLLIAQKSLSLPSFIGLVMLMGIATKNSILLVEYAIVAMRDHHLSRLDAIREACHKRARPIIMTTIAMGAGMLPVAIGLGSSDQSFRAPMAVAVIGGLLTSTVLSLLVIPAVYTYIDDLGIWFNRKMKKMRHQP
ncbi:efflux RND transporter permease subunit [Aquirhabdus sp.]|uniref:efflux RND transporter permease subunit n=1 Tax=Aquirhabdus sp. TaxID=2824160 RepID=UPI00396CB9A4